ncbi:MAG: 23S rRNA (pseudouridine(1915)-N(3))-methyltransferase RlmH [Flavobacteriaceae bacterium]|jgi:23S rRNA (pseudouridine1915-N3)-methyltransferase|nr:23S rRNA (pseudouridine(1915)-N(3))-methyltransferase RlmH [Flavobacteriaceae bacterium]
MKIKLLAIGKTDQPELNALIDHYQKRLKHYISFEIELIADVKNAKSLNQSQLKEKEGQLILSKIQNGDILVLLDEKGKQFGSIEFSEYLQKKMNAATKQLVFVIGGAFGFSDDVYKAAAEKISFSKMTFSHQMIRLFLAEQLYRSFTILKNEPYHHE